MSKLLDVLNDFKFTPSSNFTHMLIFIKLISL